MAEDGKAEEEEDEAEVDKAEGARAEAVGETEAVPTTDARLQRPFEKVFQPLFLPLGSRGWKDAGVLCPLKERKTSCAMASMPYRPLIMTSGSSKNSMPLTGSGTGFGRQAGF
jgi:hypothetical protein